MRRPSERTRSFNGHRVFRLRAQSDAVATLARLPQLCMIPNTMLMDQCGLVRGCIAVFSARARECARAAKYSAPGRRSSDNRVSVPGLSRPSEDLITSKKIVWNCNFFCFVFILRNEVIFVHRK